MDLIVLLAVLGMAIAFWLAHKSAKRNRQEVNNFTNGTVLPGFHIDAIHDNYERILALDRSNKKVALVGATWIADHPIEPNRFIYPRSTVGLEKSDIQRIQATSMEDGKLMSVDFILTTEMPKGNRFRKLSIIGNPHSFEAFINEVAKCLDVPVVNDMRQRNDA